MFVGTLTRDSVLKAVSSGISSQEIIAYLQSRAHPQALARPPDASVVPEVRWRPFITPKSLPSMDANKLSTSVCRPLDTWICSRRILTSP